MDYSIVEKFKKCKKYNLFSICLICCIPLSFIWYGFVLLPMIGLLIKFAIIPKIAPKFEYSTENYDVEHYNNELNIWKSLNACESLWYIASKSYNQQKRTSAGASVHMNRNKIQISTTPLYFLKANVEMIHINSLTSQIIILPDRVISVGKKYINIIPKNKLKLVFHSSKFVEYIEVPSDAQIIDYTWRYVNQNGSPDRRYKNNTQLPICDYGIFEIIVDDKTYEIMGSNKEVVKAFVNNMRKNLKESTFENASLYLSEGNNEVVNINITGVLYTHDDSDPQKLIPYISCGEQLYLKTEPLNPYDSFAVKVQNANGKYLGWIPSGHPIQQDLFVRLQNGETITVYAKEKYCLKSDDKKYGLSIDVCL